MAVHDHGHGFDPQGVDRANLWLKCDPDDELDLDGDCVPEVNLLQTAFLVTVFVTIVVYLFLKLVFKRWFDLVDSLTLVILDVGIAFILTGFAISNL